MTTLWLCHLLILSCCPVLPLTSALRTHDEYAYARDFKFKETEDSFTTRCYPWSGGSKKTDQFRFGFSEPDGSESAVVLERSRSRAKLTIHRGRKWVVTFSGEEDKLYSLLGPQIKQRRHLVWKTVTGLPEEPKATDKGDNEGDIKSIVADEDAANLRSEDNTSVSDNNAASSEENEKDEEEAAAVDAGLDEEIQELASHEHVKFEDDATAVDDGLDEGIQELASQENEHDEEEATAVDDGLDEEVQSQGTDALSMVELKQAEADAEEDVVELDLADVKQVKYTPTCNETCLDKQEAGLEFTLANGRVYTLHSGQLYSDSLTLAHAENLLFEKFNHTKIVAKAVHTSRLYTRDALHWCAKNQWCSGFDFNPRAVFEGGFFITFYKAWNVEADATMSRVAYRWSPGDASRPQSANLVAPVASHGKNTVVEDSGLELLMKRIQCHRSLKRCSNTRFVSSTGSC